MENLINRLIKLQSASKLILLALTIFNISGLQAQENRSIKGILTEQKNSLPVPFATVALIRSSDSAMIKGSVSDVNGVFAISRVAPGNYRLRASIVGFKTETRDITVAGKGVTDAGTILLQESTLLLKELEIVGDQVKAASESKGTSFFVTKKILDASVSGMDVLKFIPGIQVDFTQKISLEGSRNIQVFVDGKERDGNYIGQLDPVRIEKVVIVSRTGSDLDGNSTGAINIILKKERNAGISGQICAEIPTSSSEIYLRPSGSLNCVYKKLGIFTSYKGELTYLDLYESTVRKSGTNKDLYMINSNQYVRQKNWSHRFNLGLDYSISSRTQVNFFGYYNPWSRELDGNAEVKATGSINSDWAARKEDSDRNAGLFLSLYYNHAFRKEGCEFKSEISNYNLDATNSTTYSSPANEHTTATQTNTFNPTQNLMIIRMDFTTPVTSRLILSTGAKGRYQVLKDGSLADYRYTEDILAGYASLAYNHPGYDLRLGLRGEYSVSILENNFRNPVMALFPNAAFNYKINPQQNIRLAFSRSVKRPSLYQLNPLVSTDDPYSISSGNPYLKAEFRNALFIEYSFRFKCDFLAMRLFYNKITSAINDLTIINDTGVSETRPQNLGSIDEFGLQLSGTFKLGFVTLNPYLRVYNQSTFVNNLAGQYGVMNRDRLTYDASLSAILSFKHDFSMSLVFQYACPVNEIQGNSFSDALYFISLDKTFKQKFTAGLVCAMPFARSFTYQGSETDQPGLYSRYEGNAQIRPPFCWLKLSYRFSNGKKKDVDNHATEEIDNKPKKGY